MRGTWLHRKLGDRLFAREMWQPERGRFAVGCVIGVFFAMMPVPVQMLAAALLAFLVRVNIPAAVACTWVNSIESVLSRFVLPRAGADRSSEGGHACIARPSALAASGGRAHLGHSSLDRSLSTRPSCLGLVVRACPPISKREVVKKIAREFENALKFMQRGHSSTVRAGGS